jgi:Ca2+-binding RTX toxin-like protein
VLKVNDPSNPSATDQITIKNWYSSASYQIENFQFADGSSMTASGMSSMVIDLYGTSGNDTLTGNANSNYLDGGLGADTLNGGVGDDTYVVDNASDVTTENANEGTDLVQSSVTRTLGANLENLTLTGSSTINGTGNTLNNVLSGNSAANTLTGNTGNDTYQFGLGSGVDTIVENDATVGNTDLAQFAAGTAADQIWFQHVGNNLEVSIIGTSDKLTIQNWYSGSNYHVEQFKTTDGNKLLLDSNVENLVQAMAAFSPPAAGQTTLPQNYQDALAPTIAANWQ